MDSHSYFAVVIETYNAFSSLKRHVKSRLLHMEVYFMLNAVRTRVVHGKELHTSYSAIQNIIFLDMEYQDVLDMENIIYLSHHVKVYCNAFHRLIKIILNVFIYI